MSDYGTSIVWIGVLIALVPTLALFVYLAKGKKSMWLGFVIGAVGWIVALVRVPILQGLGEAFLRSWILSTGTIAALYISIGVNALFAGLFEEGIRYGLMKNIQRIRVDSKHILSFGLGWGFGEALLIYAAAVISAVYMQGESLPFTSFLLGALERNITTAVHVGITFVIFRAVTKLRFLYLAIGIHFIVDFVGVSLMVLTENVWTTYSFALAIVVILVGYAYKLSKNTGNRIEDIIKKEEEHGE